MNIQPHTRTKTSIQYNKTHLPSYISSFPFSPPFSSLHFFFKKKIPANIGPVKPHFTSSTLNFPSRANTITRPSSSQQNNQSIDQSNGPPKEAILDIYHSFHPSIERAKEVSLSILSPHPSIHRSLVQTPFSSTSNPCSISPFIPTFLLSLFLSLSPWLK